MDFGDRSDNPFAVSLQANRRPRKQAWKAALRFFLLVCVCLAVCLVITSEGPKWLVQRLTGDFATLSSAEKKERLVQISDLGPSSIPWLVQSMNDSDLEVARAAYDLLREAQNNWSVLEPPDRMKCHSTLVESVQKIAIDLPDDRTGWGANLLQQTVMTTVDGQGEQERKLYREANRAIESLSLTGRGNRPQIADRPSDGKLSVGTESDPLDPREPKRLAMRARPLPVDQAQGAEAWTQWPPPQETRFGQVAVAADLNRANADPTGQPAGQSAMHEGERLSESASVYRSGARLQPVARGTGVELSAVNNPSSRMASFKAAEPESEIQSEIQSVAHLVDSPLETYDDASVMRWLTSEHAALRQKAEATLQQRGYRDAEISIATQLVSADTQTRLQLIDAIAQSPGLDPRPWMLMMLEDPNRDVKLRVISVLATMDDPAISQRLQLHLVDERDPTVAARIRRVLKLR